MTVDHPLLLAVLERQSGVVARPQLIALDLRPHEIRRLLRRRELASAFPGIYVDHTGDLTWLQRAWAATLATGPAALAGRSALRAELGPGWRGARESDLIEVAIDENRRVVAPPGVEVRRVVGLASKVRWAASPPRMYVAEAAVDVAAGQERITDMVEVLASVVRARATTATRLLEVAHQRPRLAQRALLTGLLADLEGGTCSTLEHGYLQFVERPHRLPAPERQFHQRVDGRSVYRDARYERLGVLIELDGQLHALTHQRDRDLDRDLIAAVDGAITLRLGWGQVFDRGCATASRVGAVLQQRGWRGSPHPCSPDCPAGLQRIGSLVPPRSTNLPA